MLKASVPAVAHVSDPHVGQHQHQQQAMILVHALHLGITLQNESILAGQEGVSAWCVADVSIWTLSIACGRQPAEDTVHSLHLLVASSHPGCNKSCLLFCLS